MFENGNSRLILPECRKVAIMLTAAYDLYNCLEYNADIAIEDKREAEERNQRGNSDH